MSADSHAIRARLVSVLSFAASTAKHTIPVSSMIAPARTRPRTSRLLASATWGGIDTNTDTIRNGSSRRTVRTAAGKGRASAANVGNCDGQVNGNRLAVKHRGLVAPRLQGIHEVANARFSGTGDRADAMNLRHGAISLDDGFQDEDAAQVKATDGVRNVRVGARNFNRFGYFTADPVDRANSGRGCHRRNSGDKGGRRCRGWSALGVVGAGAP